MSFPASIPTTNPQNITLQQPVGQVKAQRNPASTDNTFAPGTEWQNTVTGTFFKCVSAGISGAVWDPFAGPTAGDISTLTGNSGGAVTGDSSGNVNLLGQSGQIVVTGSPGTNTLTISLAGGGTAVDSFQPDTGTNPVVPDATGLVKILGQSTPNTSGIRISGGTNELDLSMYSPFEGDFSFTQSNASSNTTRKLQVTNADTANLGSNAQFIASTGGATGGDPQTIWSIAGATDWSAGIDNSDSDSWKISQSTSLGTNDSLTIDTTGFTAIPRGNLRVGRSAVGSSVSADIVNTDNTSGTSNAVLHALVGGESGGDPYTYWQITGTNDWVMGIDNSDSNALVISASATPGTTNTWKMTTIGSRTMPLQPAFRAVKSASSTNATGDGTVVTLICDTSSFDQQSNYNTGTGAFLAPITGKYLIGFTIELGNLGAAHTKAVYSINNSGSGSGSAVLNINPFTCASSDNLFTFSWCGFMNLTALDSITITVAVYNSTKTVSIDGNGTGITQFWGELVC